MKKKKKKRKRVLFETPYVNISFREDTRILVAEWIGYLTIDEVRTGCSIMSEFIVGNKVKTHLSDHSALLVLSPEVQNYLINEWFAEVERAGLMKIGVVIAADAFAEATVEKVNKNAVVGHLEITGFGSEPECIAWLLS